MSFDGRGLSGCGILGGGGWTFGLGSGGRWISLRGIQGRPVLCERVVRGLVKWREENPPHGFPYREQDIWKRAELVRVDRMPGRGCFA